MDENLLIYLATFWGGVFATIIASYVIYRLTKKGE